MATQLIDSTNHKLNGAEKLQNNSEYQIGSSKASKLDDNNKDEDEAFEDAPDYEPAEPIKCSAIHTLDRDMPDFNYSHLTEQVRAAILAHDRDNPGLYSRPDIERCKNDSWFIERFLLRHKCDVEAALALLKKALRFRNESLTHLIKRADFPAEFYKIAGVFPYEEDRRGNKLLYIRVKVHRRVPEINAVLQAFLYHNLNYADELANGKGISLVLDCTGGGLVNADMDMLQFIISTLVNYFPKGFSYLLVHNLPWILKPFWHLAKVWVADEHRQLVKFSDSQSIYEYVEAEKLPDFMGGTCKKDYTAPPENCTTLEEAAKLWGVERRTVRKILMRFSEYLPLDTIENFDANTALYEDEDLEVKNDSDEENKM